MAITLGVLKTCYGIKYFPQAISSTERLHNKNKHGYPVDLVVNFETPTRSHWSEVRLLQTNVKEHYYWRIKAFLTTRFDRTLFLDNDVYIIQTMFVHNLLTDVNEISDIAMPIDPNRGKETTIFGYNNPIPPVCGAVISYNLTSTRPLFEKALELYNEPSEWRKVRKGDQEAIYISWTKYVKNIRMLILPEETYCPWYNHNSKLTWQTSWRTRTQAGQYRCKAVHGPHAVESIDVKNAIESS